MSVTQAKLPRYELVGRRSMRPGRAALRSCSWSRMRTPMEQRRLARCAAGKDGSPGSTPSQNRSSQDFATSFARRLGDYEDGSRSTNGTNGASAPEAPHRPSSDFVTAASRRATRDSTRESFNVESELTDPFGRRPPRRPSLDVVGKQEKPPIRGMRPRDELIYDEAKERAREFRRLVFDFDYWANTRATGRYFFHFWNIPRSRILLNIVAPAAFATLIAAAVAFPPPFITDAVASLQSSGLGQMFPVRVSPEPVLLTSSTISLLLVFRTSQSYNRFDEVRKMWGLLLNRTRDLVREAISFFPADAVHTKATFARWTIALSLSLQAHLRPNVDLRALAQEYLTEDELSLLMTADHRVLLCLQVLSEVIANVDMKEAQRWQMMDQVTTFEDILGGCERLLRTPLPVAYTRHTSRFMIIWVTALPLLLVPKLGTMVVPMTFIVALLLMGIEEIGVEIEEPFGILPLEVIAAKSRTDIIELINSEPERRSIAAVKYEYDDVPFA